MVRDELALDVEGESSVSEATSLGGIPAMVAEDQPVGFVVRMGDGSESKWLLDDLVRDEPHSPFIWERNDLAASFK